MHRHTAFAALARVLIASLVLAAVPQAVHAQYGNNPPQQPKPKKPEPAEAPPPAAVKSPTSAPTRPATSQPAKPVGKRVDVAPADVKWLDHLPKEDRAALDELLGWAPPAFASDLQWIGSAPLTWDSLRGKVVVIQSFTTGNIVGRKWPERVAEALKDYDAKDLRIVALHTPEEAEGAKDFLTKKPAPAGVAVAVDAKGNYCDALAIYKHPINILVDRSGAVRYAGLNDLGLEAATKLLIAEPFKQDVVVAQRSDDSAEAAASTGPEFPPITGEISHANDIRGKRAPEFFVSDWANGKAPDASGKVVVVDFWATWCGPCVASIPHMNDLATRFRDDVVCVGITDEKRSDFDKGMDKLKDKSITLKSFQYSVALDPTRRMYNSLNISAIPLCIVMDRNWTVRWQGHPATLDAATLEQIIKADKAQTGNIEPKKPGSPKRKRWTAG